MDNINTNSKYTNIDAQLEAYLQGKLSQQEMHEFELKMNESNMLHDAVDGLQQINTEHLQQHVNSLNKQLYTLTKQNKAKRTKRLLVVNQWYIIAAFVILFIAVICFVFIKFLL